MKLLILSLVAVLTGCTTMEERVAEYCGRYIHYGFSTYEQCHEAAPYRIQEEQAAKMRNIGNAAINASKAFQPAPASTPVHCQSRPNVFGGYDSTCR